MDKSNKFVLPSPNFNKSVPGTNPVKTPYLTPCGMNLLPREKQPPPMYGPRGATVPPRFLKNQKFQKPQFNKKFNQNFNPRNNEGQDVGERQFCEACDMEFQTLEDLRRHKSQHESCPVEGCKYRGHPHVMDKHVNVLHSSGLFDKFKKLSSPEEIKAWREERKKRYPSLANVLLKQKAKEQRQQRGERLEPNKSRFGRPEDRKRLHNNQKTEKDFNKSNENPKRGRNRGKFRNQNEQKNFTNSKTEENLNSKTKDSAPNNQVVTSREREKEKPGTTKAQNEDLDNEDLPKGFKRFKGSFSVEDYKLKNDEKVLKNNALGSILANYCSDDEDNSSSNESLCEENIDKTEKLKTDIPAIKSVSNNCKNTECPEEHTHVIPPDCSKTSNSPITNKAEIDFSPEKVSMELSKNPPYSSKEKIGNSFEEAPQEVPIKHKSTLSQNSISSTNILSTAKEETNNSSDEAPEEVPISHSSSYEPQQVTAAPKVQKEETKSVSKTSELKKRELAQKKRKSGLDYRKTKLRKQNTMLEKLLEPDIRHERNVLLQCVRFVCQNSFFGIGAPKPSTNE